MGTPQKHAEKIKAWADGAEIEGRSASSDWKWRLLQHPVWDPQHEYRIKSTKKTVVAYLSKHPDYGVVVRMYPLGQDLLAEGWKALGQHTFEYEE